MKCTARVAISQQGIIGPFWFEDDNEQSVTVNTERYLQVLDKFWRAFGQQRGVIRDLQWLQQKGALVLPPTQQTNHWCGCSSFSLTNWSVTAVTRIGRRIHRTRTPQISICGDIYLKDRVYGNNPQTIPDLKTGNIAETSGITKEECRRAIENFAHWIQVCLQ